ncbi:MAG: cyanate permease [Firmicutes bacterium]|nr:cyanate permease [Bacillota bacterium]
MDISGRWRFVVIGFVMMLVVGFLDAWSMFVLPIEQEFGWSRDQTALVYSLAMIFLAGGILLGGPLIDYKGPRAVSIIAGILLGVGLMSASWINSLFQLYVAYSLLCGLAIGVLYNCTIATVVRWFPDKRGLVTGLLMVGTGVGSLILGIWVAPLFKFMSWRAVFRILAAISMTVILIAGQLLRNPPLAWQEAAELSEAKASAQAEKDFNWKDVLVLPAFWGLWLWHLFVVSGGQTALGHIVPFGVEQGISANQAAIAMGVLAVFNAFGRVLFGYLADQMGRKFAMVLASITTAVGMAMLAILPPVLGMSGLIAAAILIGIGYGGTIPQVSAVVGAFFGTKHFGANFGLVSTGIAVASVIGPYLTGWVKTMTGSYEGSFYFLTVLALVSSIIAFYINKPRTMTTKMATEVCGRD